MLLLRKLFNALAELGQFFFLKRNMLLTQTGVLSQSFTQRFRPGFFPIGHEFGLVGHPGVHTKLQDFRQ